MQRSLSNNRIIRNFVAFNRRPFNLSDVVGDTGIKREAVLKELSKLISEKLVTVLQNDDRDTIYIKSSTEEISRTQQQYDWTPKLEKLKKIYDLIEKYPSIDYLQTHSGYSKETVHRYLRVLIGDGCIEKHSCLYMQVRFQPKLKPYSYYAGKITNRPKSLKKKLMLEIKYFSLTFNVESPKVELSMSELELDNIRNKLIDENWSSNWP